MRRGLAPLNPFAKCHLVLHGRSNLRVRTRRVGAIASPEEQADDRS
jgi:hypothetical protein